MNVWIVVQVVNVKDIIHSPTEREERNQ
ncbi:MAG: hypothetical protein PWP59_1705, partial [Sphaerochaeta sp.]|nr:hypothetical protein [Sphaerochaeta sp.]